MIEKLTPIWKTNSNTPSRETCSNRDKINELINDLNKLREIFKGMVLTIKVLDSRTRGASNHADEEALSEWMEEITKEWLK